MKKNEKTKREKERAHVFGIFVETGLDELFERLGVVAGELRRVVLGDQKEDAHRVQVRVGRFALGQFDGRDAQRPNVGLMSTKKNH